MDRVTTPEDSDVIVTIRAGAPTSVQVTITSTDTGEKFNELSIVLLLI